TCSRNRRCAIPIRIFEKRPGPALRLNQRKDLQMSKVQPTAGLVTAGMIGGYVAARVTKIRPLGGIVLGACGIAAGGRWYRASGPGTTALLSTIYLGDFGASHPLAKKIGSWPSVLVSTAAAAGAARVLNDKQCPLHSTKPVGKTVKSAAARGKVNGLPVSNGITPCWPKAIVATWPTTTGTGRSRPSSLTWIPGATRSKLPSKIGNTISISAPWCEPPTRSMSPGCVSLVVVVGIVGVPWLPINTCTSTTTQRLKNF